MGLIWPYPFRNDGQWRRVDAGQDLQVPVGTPILAVANGTITYANDPNGFGKHYPILALEPAIDGNPAVYYGHNTSDLPSGTRVTQGQVIAHALQTPGGNASGLPGWLEIGWWANGPTGNGQSMHDHLKAAPAWAEGDDLAMLTPEAQTFVDQNNGKWAYEDQGFLKQAMTEMEARLKAHINKVCGTST